MKKLTPSEQKQCLENSLISLNFNKKYFIYSSDARVGNKYALAEIANKYGAINTITGFMTYFEFNAFFQGIIAMQNKKIKFNK